MLIRISALLLLLVCSAHGQAENTVNGPPPADSKAYGQTLIREFDVETAQIQRFMKHSPSAKGPRESPVESVLLADTEDWRSPPIAASAGKPPFTVVVTVTGMALTDGDARSVWMAGWRNEEGQSTVFPLAGLSKPDAKAGEVFIATTAARSVRFESETKSYEAELGLVRLDNMKLSAVHVQIWSGIGNASPLQVFLAMPLVWVGLVVALLWWWFRRG